MLVRAALMLAVAVAAAACSSGTSSSPAAPTAASPTPATSAVSAGGVRDIAVTLTDALRFEPATFEVKAGERVGFMVTNAGKIRHEFFIGDEDAQREHEAEMASMGMAHDEENGISVDPGQTKQLEVTFDAPGETLVGCHEPGHYAGGMRATITITS